MTISDYFTQTVDEYTATKEKTTQGRLTLTFTKATSYQARVEYVTQELSERLYGLSEGIEYRMFSLEKPTLGNYIKIGSEYYRIARVIPQVGRNSVHHYVSLLSK